ncbi:MAG TPA: Lrp/AsnC ligand binding domain-containing protein [Candidatus Nitrosotalea sp.]|nr:Lrp/AsnC ligand binding domain-containing protein [Candidatus Nitrosotalea sp.]
MDFVNPSRIYFGHQSIEAPPLPAEKGQACPFAAANDTLRRFIRDDDITESGEITLTQQTQIQLDAERNEKIRRDKIHPTFTFITCKLGKEMQVIRKLQTLKSVKEVRQTHGRYDILVKLENMTETELRETINREILPMDGLLSVMNLTSECAV